MSRILSLTLLLQTAFSGQLGHLSVTSPKQAIVGESELSPEQQIRQVLANGGVCVETAELIIAQAKVESGHFMSSVYLQTNNPFGMRPARVRKHRVCGQYRGYAAYESLTHAVEDYLLWMEFARIPFSITDAAMFVQFLQARGYFETSGREYLRQIQGVLSSQVRQEIVA